MASSAGKSNDRVIKLEFDRRLVLQFRGSVVPLQRFCIRSLKVGNKTIENVAASVARVNAEILLGQSFLRKLKSWSVNNEQHILVLR
jgi:hypothetical protein